MRALLTPLAVAVVVAACVWLAALVHEAGHACAVLWLARRAPDVHLLGLGVPGVVWEPRDGRWRLRRVRSVVAWTRWEGGASLTPSRRAFVTFAGPAANLVSAALLLVLLPPHTLVGLAVFCSQVTAAMQLAPFRLMGAATDGLTLWRLARAARAARGGTSTSTRV